MKWTRGWRGPLVLAILFTVGWPAGLFFWVWVSGDYATFAANVLFLGAITILLGVVIARSALDRRRRELLDRTRSGLCLACGYDLRESKSRCPECGTPVKKNAAA
jgi:hypothetical protein